MKKLKKAFVFVLMAFVALSGVLFGCGDKYQNLKITTDVDQLTLFYGSTDQQDEEPTKSFVAKVEGAGNQISTDLTYSLSNDICSVKMSKGDDNSTTFSVTAKRPGQGGGTTANLVLLTKEGGKQKNISISVVYHINNLTANPNYDQKKLFVAVGDSVVSKQIDSASFRYDPDETTERELSFSLAKNIAGISLNGDLIVIDPQQLDQNQQTFDVVATSAYTPNGKTLSATTTYTIIRDFSLKFERGDESVDASQSIFMTTNTKNSDLNEQVLTVVPTLLNGAGVDKAKTPYQIEYALFLDEACTKQDNRNVLFVDKNQSDQLDLRCSDATNSADVFLKVWAKLTNFDYASNPQVLHIHIEKIANSVSVLHNGKTNTQDSSFELTFDEDNQPVLSRNGQDVSSQATYQIYDSYVGTLGFEFLVTVGDQSTAQNKFVLWCEDATNISVTDSLGDPVVICNNNTQDVAENALPSGTTLFVSATSTTSKSVLQIVSLASMQYLTKPVQNVLILEPKVGVKSIVLENPLPSERTDSTEICQMKDGTLFVPYATNLAQKSKILLKTNGYTNFLQAKTSKDLLIFDSKTVSASSEETDADTKAVTQEFVFEIVPKNVGEMQLLVVAENNFATKINIKVFTKIDKIVANINLNTTQNKQSIGAIEYQNNDKTDNVKSICAIKGGTFVWQFLASNDGIMQSIDSTITYQIENPDVLTTFGNNFVAKEVGTTKLTITIKYADDENTEQDTTQDDGIGVFKIEVDVSVYLSIKSAQIRVDDSTNSVVQVYSADSLGDLDADKYSKKQMQLLVEYSDGTTMQAGEEGEFAPSVSWSISASKSSLTVVDASDSGMVDIKSLSGKIGGANENQFEISKQKNQNIFAVVANKMFDNMNEYYVVLTVSISQLNKTISVQRKIIVKKATQITQISDLYFVDGVTGQKEYVQKTLLSNVVKSDEVTQDRLVYFVYRPYMTVVGGIYPYQLQFRTSPQDVLNNRLDFETTYQSGNNMLINMQFDNLDAPSSLNFDVLNPGLVRLVVYAQDSLKNGKYSVFAEVYISIANGGDQNTAYRISSAQDFVLMLSSQQSGSKTYYSVVNDIDMAGYVFGDGGLTFANFVGCVDGKYSYILGGETYQQSATIFGVQIRKVYSVEYTTQDANVGIFASVETNAEVKNLNFDISSCYLEFESVENARFGGVAGTNKGTISNVCVHFSSVGNGSNIKFVENAKNANIGGLVGENFGTIENCHTSGAFAVENAKKPTSIKTSRYIGGLVAKNAGRIASTNTFFNNPTPANDYSSSAKISVQNISDGTTVLGGVVGYNDAGEITNQSFDGSLTGGTNVGGLVGFDDGGTIVGGFADGLVVGTKNVGGLVGFAQNSSISKSSVNFYVASNYILGNDFVGGLVGSATDAEISLCYVKSFAQNASGDVRLKSSIENQYLGGLVGSANMTSISRSYSMATLALASATQNVGGLVGKAGTITISNAFEQNSYVLAQSQKVGTLIAENNGTLTASNFYCAYQNSGTKLIGNDDSFAGTNIIRPTVDNYLLSETYLALMGDEWYLMPTKDADTTQPSYKLANYPYLTIDQKLLTIEKPNSVSVNMAQNNKLISSVLPNSNTFVVWRHQTNQTLRFADLFDVVFAVDNANISAQNSQKLQIASDYFLTADNDLVAVVGGTRGAYQLVIKGEGKVNLTITSKANSSLSCVVTIYVSNTVKNFDVLTNASFDDQNLTYNFVVGSTYRLEVASQYSTSYFVDAITTSNAILINNELVRGSYSFAYGSVSNIGACDQVQNQIITFRPYVLFEGQKVYVPGVEKSFVLSSVYGIDEFLIDTPSAQILPDTQLVVTAVATGVNLNSGYAQDQLEIVLRDLDGNILQTGNQADGMLTISVQKVAGTDKHTVKNIVLVTINFDNVDEQDYGKQFELVFTFSQNTDAKTQICQITLQKLELQKISVDFYKDTERGNDGKYTIQDQVSSSSIVSGELGLLRINLSPEKIEKQIESIEIFHAQTDVYALSFTQLVQYGAQYLDVGTYVSSINNGFGISVFAWSKYQDSFSFDGNLYIGCIIAKTVPQNTQFKITIKVNYNGNLTKLLEFDLFSEMPSEVKMEYEFDGATNGTYGDLEQSKNAVYVPLGIQKTLVVTATNLYNANATQEEVANTVSIYVNDTLTNLKVARQNVVIGQDKTTISIPFEIVENQNEYQIKSNGQTFYSSNANHWLNMVVECERITSGSRKTYQTKPFSICPVDFVIKSMSIDQAVGGKISVVEGETALLSVKLDCEYANDNGSQIKQKISQMQDQILESCFVFEQTDSVAFSYAYNQAENIATLVANKVAKCKIGFGAQFVYDYEGKTYQVTSEREMSDTNTMQKVGDEVRQLVAKLVTLEISRNTTTSNATIITTQTQFEKLAQVEAEELKEYSLAQHLLAGDIIWYADGGNGTTASSGSILTLENYVPFALPSNVSFDGNGCVIKIKSFADIYTGNQFGLFTSVGQNSIVKNLTVVFEQSELDFSNAQQDVVFGGICAQNQGIIYACDVYAGLVTESQVDGVAQFDVDSYQLTATISSTSSATIAGLCGENRGYISYSHSKIAISANKGYTSGFVGTNSGKISSCSVQIPAGLALANTDSMASDASLIGGFAVKNLSNGSIFGSYVATNSTDDKNGKIKSSTQLGGFVYENQGEISNSYVSALLDAGALGGFVFENTGNILSSYTQLKLSGNAQTSKQVKLFVGTDQTTGVVNNSGTLDDCYYCQVKDSGGNVVSALDDGVATQVASTAKSQFAKFAFAKAGKDDGIWIGNSGSMPTLVEASRKIEYSASFVGFYQKIGQKYYPVQFLDAGETEYYKYQATIDNATKNITPSNIKVDCVYSATKDSDFVENKVYYSFNQAEEKYSVVTSKDMADANISSMLELSISVYAQQSDQSGSQEGTQTTAQGNWININQFDDESQMGAWEANKNAGQDSNPIQIASEADWNKHIIDANKEKKFVLLGDFEISNTPNTATNNAVFAGTMLGNNMKISNLFISESALLDVSKTYAMGLFAQTKNATVKDLSIVMKNNLYANDIKYVGILTGIANSSTFVNINIDAQGKVVIGKNFVGGLAGVLKGSNCQNIDVATSVNAVYLIKDRSVTLTGAELKNYVAGDVTELDSQNITNVDYSYSGIFAGAMIDGGLTGSVVTNILASGNCMVSGYYIGLVTGLVDQKSTLSLANASIDPSQSIKSYAIAGGLVGENRGSILRSQVCQDQSANRNLTLFQGSPLFIGGLVGFNNGGKIDHCISYADARAVGTSSNLMFAYVAGGIVGLDVCGAVTNTVAFGSVKSDYIVGGIVGAETTKDYLLGKDGKKTNYVFSSTTSNVFVAEQNISVGPQALISNNFASNNWISVAGGIGDADYLTETKLKGMIVGAVITADSTTELSLENIFYNKSDKFETNYINLLDTTYKISLQNGQYVISAKLGKFVQAFGADIDKFEGKNYLDESVDSVRFNHLERYSIGGGAKNFDCAYMAEIDTILNLNSASINATNNENNEEKSKELTNSDVLELFATTIIKNGASGAIICNQNSKDFDIVYGINGVYGLFDSEFFELPQNVKISNYPSLIVNINT